MKKKPKNFIGISLLSLYFVLGGCKANERITPLSKSDSVASISSLKTYLSVSLSVSDKEIVYDVNSKEFIVRNKLIMKEKDVQKQYYIANEYKLRNGLSK